MPETWEGYGRLLFSLTDARLQILQDTGRGMARLAFYQRDTLLAALFVARDPVAVMRDYLVTLPGTEAPSVLTGQSPANMPDPGPVVCSCFGVGMNTLLTAIETQSLTTVDQIGAALQAGTNCGSCRPELTALLTRAKVAEAAE